MKQHGPWLRTAVLCGAMLLIAGTLVTRLAFLQLVKGAEYEQTSERKILHKYTENASRGELLDRNGTPLVTNSLGFEVTFDSYTWEKDEQNRVILELCQMLDAVECAHVDTLPMSMAPPFTYTFQSTNSGEGKKLAKFISEQKWPKDLGSAWLAGGKRLEGLASGGGPATLYPGAPALFDFLCEKYKVDQGLTDLQKRQIIGVRYEMEQQSFGSYTSSFTLAEGVPVETVSRISERNYQLPGVGIAVDDIRQYDTDYAAHILGRVGQIYAEEYAELKKQGYPMNATVGKDGMEKALEPYLRGIDGERSVETNVDGGVVSEEITKEPEPGDNCYLTIDIELQRVAEEALASAIEAIRARNPVGKGGDAEGGAAVVIDVHSGEVLALASYPTYQLKTYGQDFNELSVDESAPLFNRVISGVYPPGSTFKMVTALAALEEGVITPQTKIKDEGVYMYYAPNYTPACWLYRKNHGSHGTINVSQAIKYSCNYFFYEISRQLGIERLNHYAKAFGLGEMTGIELGGEKPGNLAGPESRAAKGGEDWQAGETIQAGIGQSEQQFTPLQLASYVATLANGGTHYRPHLLKEVKNYSYTETVEVIEPQIIDQIPMSKASQDAIFQGMLGVTTDDGTAASQFRNYPILVGGKTGSAQTTKTRSDHGIFVSFAPYDDPKIAVCVIGEYAGSGGNMSPVAIAIYDHYFNLNKETPPEGEGAQTGQEQSTANPPVPPSTPPASQTTPTAPPSTPQAPEPADPPADPVEPPANPPTDPVDPPANPPADPVDPPAEPAGPAEPVTPQEPQEPQEPAAPPDPEEAPPAPPPDS